LALLYAIIFVTGGAVLALELLASRIMTPYFGVSLYIWSGILSITLVALALGYHAGGRFAERLSARRGARASDRLCHLFLAMPAAASAALIAACLAYPYLFPWLARLDLVAGAFAAGSVLLFVPLVATSAMNPLLVAILLAREPDSARGADAGAGRVFFVSTLGSVAGVLATAFGLIPSLSNFSSVLVVAVVLAALPLAALVALPRDSAARNALAGAAMLTLAISGALLWKADAYTGRMWPVSFNGTRWHVEGAAGSLFGTVKVLASEPRAGDGRFIRVYFQDGLIQNRLLSDGTSLSLYTYALEALARMYRPAAREALVLGLGAGVVPMRLAQAGIAVDAVEIDPASFRIAQRYFGFRPERVRVHVEDARTYLRGCDGRYEIIVVDLFHGDGVPEYLLTREFFADLKRCLARDGVAVFNSFADLLHPATYAHFLTTLRAELPAIVLYRPPDSGAVHVNSFVVASARPLPEPAPNPLHDVIASQADTLDDMLRAPRTLDADLLRDGVIVTDAHNPAAHELARAQLFYRAMVVQELPAAFLMN